MRAASGWQKGTRARRPGGAGIRPPDAPARIPKLAGVTITGLLLVVIFAVLLSDSFDKHGVVLESFSVNSELRGRGFDEQVIAGRFAQDIRLMIKGARSIKKSQVLAVPRSAAPPDLEVPATKISVKGVVKYLQAFAPFRHLRRLLGVNPLRVNCEAALQGKQVRIDLHLLRDVDGETREDPRTFKGEAEKIDDLLTQAGEAIMASAEPYLYASYLYQSKRMDQAEAQVLYCLNSDPARNSHLALTLWGLILIDKKKYDEAIAKFEEATREPKTGEQHRELAAAYNNWGLALLAKRAPDEAIVKLREAIAHDPGFALAYNNYGKALLDKKETAEGKQKLKEATSLDPGLAVAYYNLGVALHDETPDEALPRYKTAIQLAPDFIPAYCNLAMLQTADLEPPQHEEAIKTIEKAIEQDKEAACAYNALGAARVNLGDRRRAIAAYERSVALYTAQRAARQDERDFMEAYARAHNNLGATHEDEGNYEAAVKNYQAAFDIDQRYYYALTGKGDALRKWGRFDGAAAAYQTVLDAREADAHSRFVAYKGMGLLLRARCRACPPSQKRKEVSMFEAALTLRPHDEEVRAALEESRKALK